MFRWSLLKWRPCRQYTCCDHPLLIGVVAAWSDPRQQQKVLRHTVIKFYRGRVCLSAVSVSDSFFSFNCCSSSYTISWIMASTLRAPKTVVFDENRISEYIWKMARKLGIHALTGQKFCPFSEITSMVGEENESHTIPRLCRRWSEYTTSQLSLSRTVAKSLLPMKNF